MGKRRMKELKRHQQKGRRTIRKGKERRGGQVKMLSWKRKHGPGNDQGGGQVGCILCLALKLLGNNLLWMNGLKWEGFLGDPYEGSLK